MHILKKIKQYLFGKKPTEINILSKNKKFNFGIGESEIYDDYILIKNYPFYPASVFPNKKIIPSDIKEIHLNSYPPTLKINNELIFISRKNIDALNLFVQKNKVKTAERKNNWSLITEPFLDTNFNEEQKKRAIELLTANGFSKKEITELREEIAEQMRRYNFDTMLWEWGELSLRDVLSAMQAKYDKKEFEEFYWRAMEVEMREA